MSFILCFLVGNFTIVDLRAIHKMLTYIDQADFAETMFSLSLGISIALSYFYSNEVVKLRLWSFQADNLVTVWQQYP